MTETRELMKVHRPSVVVLMEPRVSGAVAEGVCKCMGKNRWIRSEVCRFSRGVWVF